MGKKLNRPIATKQGWCQCHQCVKSFRSESDLKRNILTHKHLYACSYCAETFTEKMELQLHERIHTGEKTYAYSRCDKSFKKPGLLKYHEHVYTHCRKTLCLIKVLLNKSV